MKRTKQERRNLIVAVLIAAMMLTVTFAVLFNSL